MADQMTEDGRENRAGADDPIHEAYAQLGRMGGEAVKEKYGPDFYSAIGKKGGEARKASLGHDGYQQLGQMGGQTVKNKYGPEFYQQIGNKGGEARREQMARGVVRKAAEKPDATDRPAKGEKSSGRRRTPSH